MKKVCVYCCILCAVVFLISGCTETASMKYAANDSPSETTMQARATRIASEPQIASPDVLPGKTDSTRKRVYTGTVDIEVNNRDYAISQLRKQTKTAGGYFEVLRKRMVVIRIPAEKFTKYIAELSKIGEITDRSIQVVDVTNQFHDLQAELKNLKAVRTRLKELLAKADNIKDTLAIENKLNRVQTKIDQLTGRLKRLGRQIAYAKLTIRLQLPNTSSASRKMRNFRPVYWINSLGLDSLYR